MSTLREHLEAIRDLHCCATDECVNEGVDCTAWSHALDALAILDEAERAATWLNGENVEELRLVPDPPASS